MDGDLQRSNSRSGIQTQRFRKSRHEHGCRGRPFVESKELVGGYMILEADDYEGAVEVMQGCPGASAPGGSFEIRELMSM